MYMPHKHRLTNGRVSVIFAGAKAATDSKQSMQVAKRHVRLLTILVWTHVVSTHSSRNALSEHNVGMGA